MGSKFNVVSFGSNFRSVFPSSILYDEVTFGKALKEVSKFEADMGGTEIYQPMKRILT